MIDRKVFHDSVVPLAEQPGLAPTGMLVNDSHPEHAQERMDLLFSLEVPAARQLAIEDKVARGEVVPPEELSQAFAAAPADLEALTKWLQREGFEDVEVTHDRTGVRAHAPVERIGQSLGVQFVRVTRGGLTCTAARNAPSLPSSVGGPVRAILGLQPFRKAHKHFRMRTQVGGNRVMHEGEHPPEAGRNVANQPPYLVPEILGAYGAKGVGVTGKGQTIAILIDTFPRDSDLVQFWRHNGIAPDLARIEKINVKGGHLPPPEGEETLDVEWASGIAPGAKVRIYASGSLSFVDLDRALDRIIADLPSQPGMRQLSISLGLGETYFQGARAEIDAQHQKFLRLAASGVNVFVSTGDAGSNPDSSGHDSGGPLQVEYESSDPCVVAVGGTSLSLGPTGTVTREIAWSASGGGKSILFHRPVWQRGHGLPRGAHRLVPDVSLAADPELGAFVFLNGRSSQIGGTSWSAPAWAGFCALINEARLKAAKPALPFLNPLLYPLLGSFSFRDITQGSNGAYDSASGYDLVTGLGVPNVHELIKALAG